MQSTARRSAARLMRGKRRGGDSNPRASLGGYTISSRAVSTGLTHLSAGGECITGVGIALKSTSVGWLSASLTAARAEEALQQLARFRFAHAAAHREAMVEPRVLGEVEHAAERAALRIGAAEDDALQARLDDGADAHGARLDGHEQLGVNQPIVAHGRTRRAQGDDFGVCARVAARDRLVAPAPDDLARPHDHRPHGYLAGAFGGGGLAQAFAHPDLIRLRHRSARSAVRPAVANLDTRGYACWRRTAMLEVGQEVVLMSF